MLKMLKNLKNRIYKYALAFIPHKISNRLVINVWDLLRSRYYGKGVGRSGDKSGGRSGGRSGCGFRHGIRCKKFFNGALTGRLSENEKAFFNHKESIERNGGYVEDQNRYLDMFYGKMTMSEAGCAVFATYNALCGLCGSHSQGMSLSEIIAEYERDGMVLSGRWGTSPKAVRDFFDRQGFKTELVTDEREFDSLAERSESLIFTMYNDKDDISGEIHTVNISKERGGYIAHNVHCNGRIVGPYGGISELTAHIDGGRVKGICLIGILHGRGSC